MSLISKRCLQLLAVCLLASAVSGWSATSTGQVQYTLYTRPNTVATTGDAEVLGAMEVMITSVVSGTTSVSDAMNFYFPGTSCDNDTATGVTLSEGGGFTSSMIKFATTWPTFAADAVYNQADGCYVAVNVNYSGGPPIGAWFELDGVRARMELERPPITVGAYISGGVAITASSGFDSIAPPSTGYVGLGELVLAASISTATYLTCEAQWKVCNEATGEGYPRGCTYLSPASITVSEPYAADFVDYTRIDPDYSSIHNARPPYGETNGTQIMFTVAGVPTGVTMKWPSLVPGNIGSAFPWGDHLVLDSSNTGVITAPGGTVLYDYSCYDQKVCDQTYEIFTLYPGLAASTAGLSSIAVITVQAQVVPLSTPIPGGVAAVTCNDGSTSADCAAPETNGTMPRWSDPLIPTPDAFAFISPCTTTLLFPWVLNLWGFDTGIAINNTTQDPTNAAGLTGTLLVGSFGPANFAPTTPESGTCTMYFFDQYESPVIVETTPNITTGGTYTTMVSATPFTGYAGYMIARCNFQFAHGFAAIGEPAGTSPAFAQSYLALVIPDPVVLALWPSYPYNGRADNAASYVPFTGEALAH